MHTDAADVTGPIIGLMVFALLIASAAVGIIVHAQVPAMLAPGEARDTVRRVVSLIAVLTVLLLGMNIVSIKSAFDSADRDVRRISYEIEELHRALHRIGSSAATAQQLLFRYSVSLAYATFPQFDAPFRGEPGAVNDLQDALEAELERLGSGPNVSPAMIQAESVLHGIIQTRWTMGESTGLSVAGWQLTALVFWLMLIFGGLGLLAPRNPVMTTVLVLSAAALACAVFLMTEFDDPFTGAIVVSSDPLLHVLRSLSPD